MPTASCNTCLNRVCNTDLQPCHCHTTVSKSNCDHWQHHHDEIDGLCHSARIGCRMCSELWRFFFKEKTPEQYIDGVHLNGDTHIPGRGFLIGNSIHAFIGTGTHYRVVELDSDGTPSSAQGSSQPGEDVVLRLDFSINSPMIYEVEERQYILRKVSREFSRPFLSLLMSN